MKESLKPLFVTQSGIMRTVKFKKSGYYYKKFSSFLKVVKLSKYAGDIINIQERISLRISRQSQLFFRIA